MSDRFPDANLDLTLLPPPAVIKTVDYEVTLAERLDDFATRYLARTGLVYDTRVLESEPGVILQEEGAYREIYNLTEINTAAKAVMALYARGTDQDNLFALLGIRRLTITPADTTTTPITPAVMEDDGAFLARAQLALEGTAPGLTGGGYASIALRASSEVRRVSLVREAGGIVHVILQGRGADGSVSAAAVLAVAAALNDDFSDDPGTGSQLTDTPMVQSAVPLPYDIVVRAEIPSGPSLNTIVGQSAAQLALAATGLAITGNTVTTDALIAAGRIGSMRKFILDSPAAYVPATAFQTPYARSIAIHPFTPAGTITVIDQNGQITVTPVTPHG